MENGRYVCHVMKAIRKAVADANGISYEPAKCTYVGECNGTCPACDAELAGLERELALRRMAGKVVTVAGIALGTVALSSCSSENLVLEAIDNKTEAVGHNSEVFGAIDEESPIFPGGQAAMMKYIEQNIRYPDTVNRVEGRVVVSFVVDEDGTLKDVKVIRSLAPEYDEEALRLVRNMPKWKPGRLRGRCVKVRYTLPVKFKSE